MNLKNPVFNEGAGEFISVRKAQALKDTYYNAKLASGQRHDELTRSEFFGLDNIKQLLNQKGCVGLRIHYASRWEDENGREVPPTEGKLKPRILITGVDSRGRDLPANAASGGLKDDANGNETMVLAEGMPCPQHCAE
ncbi:hypothetical protein IC229_24690 [Spirosoma sp. BT702]|uniref:Uncharacterized protein n=1 Tax=Spirosoma profusum TaxID=2771354 RepID=A0A926XZV2_9BACT|nr:hypothetical protein [Spirosoma profusum]MBD2703867.1 hypothetical protein [Spirosoma profusum]